MGHLVAQDPIYTAVLSFFILLAATSLGIVAAILFARAENVRRDAQRRELQELWRTVFAQALLEPPTSLPPLKEQDAPAFCELWNYLQGSLRGAARENLIAVATQLGVDAMAMRMLRAPRVGDRLLGTVTLGNLRHVPAWDEIQRLMLSSDPVLSLMAAQALMRIDAARALALIVPLLGKRSDWPVANLASILQEAGPDAVSDPLCAGCLSATPEVAARMARLLPMAHYQKAEAAGRQMLSKNTDTELLTSCLRLLHSPADRDMICSFLEHPAWEVRLHAVKSLGRIAGDAEVPLLILRLSDDAWWVRFRAAEALASIPTFDLYRWEGFAGLSVKSDLRSALLQALRERKETGTA